MSAENKGPPLLPVSAESTNAAFPATGQAGQRFINWLDNAEKSVQLRLPEANFCSGRLADRLSALLLERLPEEQATEMFELLPDDVRSRSQTLEHYSRMPRDSSIGYSSFLDTARVVCGSAGMERSEESLRSVTDAFLWGVVHELPAELKAELINHLPAELRSRMDLFTASADDSRVA